MGTGNLKVTPSLSHVPSYLPYILDVIRASAQKHVAKRHRQLGVPAVSLVSLLGSLTQRAKYFPAGDSVLLLLLGSRETGSYLDILSSFSGSLEELFYCSPHKHTANGHLVMPAH